MPRVVILGCGTEVGKTRTSVALLRELGRRNLPTMGLKPIESGLAPSTGHEPPPSSDAYALALASSLRPTQTYPRYGFSAPVSPHLAARQSGSEIVLQQAVAWVGQAEVDMTPLVGSNRALWSVVETAGGVFSPLSTEAANFDLALALDPAIWVLVAADALGVLHEVSATLQAMRARGRSPDHLVLSSARPPDASTGINAAELATLGIATPSAVLARDDDRGISALVDRLVAPPGEGATQGTR